MGKSLTDMLADTAPAPLPKASATITLIEGQHILDEIEALKEQLEDVTAAEARIDENGERIGPPLKAGERPADTSGIEDGLLDAMRRLREHQIKVGLTGTASGDWHRWKDAHPPRKDSPGDMHVARGWCNSVDLFADLGKYVSHWDGEPIPAGTWDDRLAERVCYADRRDLVTLVVKMFEQGVNRVPFSSSGSPATELSATD